MQFLIPGSDSEMTFKRHMRCLIAALGFVLLGAASGWCGQGGDVPTEYGVSFLEGLSYTPTNDVGFSLLSGSIVYDYDRIWPHEAPEALRFKVVSAAGIGGPDHDRFVGSAGIMALYWLDRFSGPAVRPYVEAGIGIIYTDFQLEKMGLRVNFNPQAGVGVQLTESPLFFSLRFHHVSNGGLHDDNDGINTMMLQVGWTLK
jgi:hypothetical protein